MGEVLASEDVSSGDIGKVSADDVINVVCESYGIVASDLKSSRRAAGPSEARKAFAYLARKKTVLTLASISEFLGLKRHSSAGCMIKRFADAIRLKQRLDPFGGGAGVRG